MSWLIIIFIIIAISTFILMLTHKDLLRDEVQEEAFNKFVSDHNIINPKKPFSLARVQIAMWTIIIIFTYLDVYFCKGCCNTISLSLNKTALILLGISIGTTAIAGTIDNSQQNNQRHQNEPSNGILLDILSDGNGISIHRFQVILFTIVAMIIYINKVSCNCATLPELDDTLLGIITISYSGYVGMKINENKT